MIHVVAIVTAKPGMRQALLAEFNANVANVHAEEGCLEYGAAIDLEDAGAMQAAFGEDTFAVIEKWTSLDTLKAHGSGPVMTAYGAKTRHMIASRAIHILRPVES